MKTTEEIKARIAEIDELYEKVGRTDKTHLRVERATLLWCLNMNSYSPIRKKTASKIVKNHLQVA